MPLPAGALAGAALLVLPEGAPRMPGRAGTPFVTGASGCPACTDGKVTPLIDAWQCSTACQVPCKALPVPDAMFVPSAHDCKSGVGKNARWLDPSMLGNFSKAGGHPYTSDAAWTRVGRAQRIMGH